MDYRGVEFMVVQSLSPRGENGPLTWPTRMLAASSMIA